MTPSPDPPPRSYRALHRPAKLFPSRTQYLENELTILNPRPWRLNLPLRDYRFEFEDLVPALAGTIGKIVMTTAVVATFAAGFGLTPEFIVANVRFEMLIAALLFVIPVSGFLNPRANLPGCHGPMIPLIGLIVLAGGHPLALGIMLGVFGLFFGLAKGGSRLVQLTGTGVRGGLLVFLGFTGLLSQMEALRSWTIGLQNELLFLIIIAVTIVIYSVLARFGVRWLAIPVCSFIAVFIALSMGAPFNFVTSPGVPILNPFYWWGETTGWMLGLPDLSHFIAVLPFAILAIAMWPPDFLGHRIFQEENYPKGSDRALMDVDDTMINCSVRQAVGSALGGGNLTSSWGTYLIPAGLAKRPIAAGAILTGIGCLIAALLGYPLDIAKWPPMLRVALIVGVFLPLAETGMQMIKTSQQTSGAGICILGGFLVNPVFGWSLAMLLHNTGLLGDLERVQSLSLTDRIYIPLLTFGVCTASMAVVGLIPGVPPLLVAPH